MIRLILFATTFPTSDSMYEVIKPSPSARNLIFNDALEYWSFTVQYVSQDYQLNPIAPHQKNELVPVSPGPVPVPAYSSKLTGTLRELEEEDDFSRMSDVSSNEEDDMSDISSNEEEASVKSESENDKSEEEEEERRKEEEEAEFSEKNESENDDMSSEKIELTQSFQN